MTRNSFLKTFYLNRSWQNKRNLILWKHEQSQKVNTLQECNVIFNNLHKFYRWVPVIAAPSAVILSLLAFPSRNSRCAVTFDSSNQKHSKQVWFCNEPRCMGSTSGTFPYLSAHFAVPPAKALSNKDEAIASLKSCCLPFSNNLKNPFLCKDSCCFASHIGWTRHPPLDSF